MKRVLCMFIAVVMLSPAALVIGKSSEQIMADNIAPPLYQGIYAAYCSSVTATGAVPKKDTMKSVLIRNQQTYSVWYTTHARSKDASFAQCWEIEAGDSMSFPFTIYRSTIYILGGTAVEKSTVQFLCEWGN